MFLFIDGQALVCGSMSLKYIDPISLKYRFVSTISFLNPVATHLCTNEAEENPEDISGCFPNLDHVHCLLLISCSPFVS